MTQILAVVPRLVNTRPQVWDRQLVAILAHLLLLGAGSAYAQNSNDINVGIQFDFSGARSQGMAGAFVAVADDATTVYGNPAGLTTFTRKEVSVEGRFWNWNTTIANNGHAYGSPTGIGVDTIAGVNLKTFHGDKAGPSFASFVYPRRNWGFGAFYRSQSRYRMTRTSEGTFFQCVGGVRPYRPYCEPHEPNDGVDRLFPDIESIALDITALGGAAALRFPQIHTAIGASVQYVTFEMDASSRSFDARNHKKYEAANFSPANLDLISTQIGNDSRAAFAVGALWTPSDRFAAGASYQYGPSFSFTAETLTGPTNLSTGGAPVPIQTNNTFNVPDHLAAGFSYRPNPNASNGWWLISVQYDLVRYSDLLDGFAEVLSDPSIEESRVFLSGVQIDDANRVRIGTELMIDVARSPQTPVAVALRGGTWYDPQHSTYFMPDDPSSGLPSPRLGLLFPKGTGQWHAAAGTGLVIGPAQVDIAADLAEAGSTFSISTVIRF